MSQQTSQKTQKRNVYGSQKGINIWLLLIAIIIIAIAASIIIAIANNKNGEEHTSNFSFDTIYESVNSLDIEEVSNIKQVDNLEDFGISKDNLEDYIFCYNEENKDWWAVLKPQADKEEIVKVEVESFIQGMNWDEDLTIISKYVSCLQKEIDGYLVYVATTSKNTSVMEKIENSSKFKK